MNTMTGLAPDTVSRACACCRYRINDRQALEQRIAGLITLSSGFGESVAKSRLCRLHDRLVSPADVCSRFAPLAD